MRHLNTDLIYQAVYDAICKITFECDPMLHDLIQKAQQAETKALPQEILGMILSNHRYAAEDRIPLCQDTGSTVVFAEIGEEIHLYGKALDASIQVATRDAQRDCPLRASIVLEPLFDRENSRDNSPAVIHTEIVPGDKLRLLVAQKGGGAENMSFMKMMSPSSNVDSILDFITEGVITAGSRPCPPRSEER